MQVSKRPLPQKTWDKIWDILTQSFTRSQQKQDIHTLLFSLLAPAERTMVAKRLMVGILHQAGVNNLNIANILRISRSTVSKHLTILEANTSYRQFLHQHFRHTTLPTTDRKLKDYHKSVGLLEAILDGYRERWKLNQP